MMEILGLMVDGLILLYEAVLWVVGKVFRIDFDA